MAPQWNPTELILSSDGGIGCRMIKTLWEELRAQGFKGSYKSVWLFTQKSAHLRSFLLYWF
jgi:hypothetical protein